MSFRPLCCRIRSQFTAPLRAALVVATLCGCSDGIVVSTRGVVLAADGTPSLLRAGSVAREVLNVSSHPIALGTVATDATSAVSLALTPSTLIELQPSTELTILALSVRKDGNETANDSMRRRDAHAELKLGTVYGSAERPDVQAEPHLTIDTADGTLATSYDCTFAITRSENITRVVCASGLLYFQPKGQTNGTELEAGSFGEWPCESCQIAPAETDTAAQEELLKAIEIVPKLRALRDSQRNKLPRG